jgi:hypothetical protein
MRVFEDMQSACFCGMGSMAWFGLIRTVGNVASTIELHVPGSLLSNLEAILPNDTGSVFLISAERSPSYPKSQTEMRSNARASVVYNLYSLDITG